jgi:hypothetical protein
MMRTPSRLDQDFNLTAFFALHRRVTRFQVLPDCLPDRGQKGRRRNERWSLLPKYQLGLGHPPPPFRSTLASHK